MEHFEIIPPLTFLDGAANTVAPLLLGCILESTVNGHTVRGRIVETEAYDQTDVASHSYKGQTPRTQVMFGPSGHLYVYFTYGMHYCCNIVVGRPGTGAAVLLRAIEPLAGEDTMMKRRHDRGGIELTNGPAKLCQALAIDRSYNGHDLREEPIRLIPAEKVSAGQITQTTRIGISQGKDVPWRFYLTDNPYVSKP